MYYTPFIWFLVFKGPPRRSTDLPLSKSLPSKIRFSGTKKTPPSVNTFGCRTERFDWKSDMAFWDATNATTSRRYMARRCRKKRLRSKVETPYPVFWKQNCRCKGTFIFDGWMMIIRVCVWYFCKV